MAPGASGVEVLLYGAEADMLKKRGEEGVGVGGVEVRRGRKGRRSGNAVSVVVVVVVRALAARSDRPRPAQIAEGDIFPLVCDGWRATRDSPGCTSNRRFLISRVWSVARQSSRVDALPSLASSSCALRRGAALTRRKHLRCLCACACCSARTGQGCPLLRARMAAQEGRHGVQPCSEHQ